MRYDKPRGGYSLLRNLQTVKLRNSSEGCWTHFPRLLVITLFEGKGVYGGMRYQFSLYQFSLVSRMLHRDKPIYLSHNIPPLTEVSGLYLRHFSRYMFGRSEDAFLPLITMVMVVVVVMEIGICNVMLLLHSSTPPHPSPQSYSNPYPNINANVNVNVNVNDQPRTRSKTKPGDITVRHDARRRRQR